MAWHGWPSVFQDSVKNKAPRWRMKSPNGFCDFLVTLCHRPPTPEHSPAAVAASGHRRRSHCRITVIVPPAVAVAAVALVSLPPPPTHLPLPLLVDCCVLYVSTAVRRLCRHRRRRCRRRHPHRYHCCCSRRRHHRRRCMQCRGRRRRCGARGISFELRIEPLAAAPISKKEGLVAIP
jgi:hypothetical protein